MLDLTSWPQPTWKPQIALISILNPQVLLPVGVKPRPARVKEDHSAIWNAAIFFFVFQYVRNSKGVVGIFDIAVSVVKDVIRDIDDLGADVDQALHWDLVDCMTGSAEVEWSVEVGSAVLAHAEWEGRVPGIEVGYGDFSNVLLKFALRLPNPALFTFLFPVEGEVSGAWEEDCVLANTVREVKETQVFCR